MLIVAQADVRRPAEVARGPLRSEHNDPIPISAGKSFVGQRRLARKLKTVVLVDPGKGPES